MSILRSLPKIASHGARISSIYQTIPQASYSICSAHRHTDINNRLHINRIPFAITTKRNKSIAAIATDIQYAISHSDTVAFLQNATISYHDYTGLPWWASIITYTICLRLITIPTQVYQQKIQARLDRIATKELPALSEKVLREVNAKRVKLKLTERLAQRHYLVGCKREFKRLYLRDNCHPLKTTVVVWLQIPLWVCQSVAIRNIVSLQPEPNSIRAMVALTQLSVGGILWIPNLIEPDVSYILPVWLGLVNLANIEVMMLEKSGQKSTLLVAATAFFRLISVASIPICAMVPSALAVYWCTSSTLAFAQNLMLMSPRVKRFFGIPTDTSYHLAKPYSTIAQRFVEQMAKRKAWCSRLLGKPKEKKNLHRKL